MCRLERQGHAGVVQGRTSDQLAPQANMTRAELAQLVRNFLQRMNLI